MEDGLTSTQITSVVAKLVYQKHALMQAQNKIDSLPLGDDFVIYDKNISDYTMDDPVVFEIYEADLACSLGYRFFERNLYKVLDALVDEGLVSYRRYVKDVYDTDIDRNIQKGFLLIKIADGLVRVNKSAQERRLKNKMAFKPFELTRQLDSKILEDNSYVVELILETNEKYGNGSLSVHFTQSGYSKVIKRFNSVNGEMPSNLRITQWILGDGYRDGYAIKISKLQEELKYTKTGSGLVAEIIPKKYEVFRNLFIPRSGKDYLKIKKGLTAEELKSAGYNVDQLQKKLLSK